LPLRWRRGRRVSASLDSSLPGLTRQSIFIERFLRR
jgi:hypothetical protein